MFLMSFSKSIGAFRSAIVVTEWPAHLAENHPELRRRLSEWLETRNLPPLHNLVEPETSSELRDRHVFRCRARRARCSGFTVPGLSPLSQLRPFPRSGIREGWGSSSAGCGFMEGGSTTSPVSARSRRSSTRIPGSPFTLSDRPRYSPRGICIRSRALSAVAHPSTWSGALSPRHCGRKPRRSSSC